MKSYFKMIFAAALIGFSTSANAIDRHSLAQYAASLKGLKKEQLKAALYDIMKQKTVLAYGGTRVRDKKRLEKVGNLVKNSYLYR